MLPEFSQVIGQSAGASPLDEFLQRVFEGISLKDEVVCLADARPDPNGRTIFPARVWRPGHSRIQGATYVCISSVRPAARGEKLQRTLSHVVRTYAVVLDDIGTKIPREVFEGRPAPHAVVETSAGNEQWWYFIEPSDPDDAARVIHALALAGVTDKGAQGKNRVVRVPGSINTKYDRRFVACLKEWHPDDPRFTLEELASEFGLILDEGYAEGSSSVNREVWKGEKTNDVVFNYLNEIGYVLDQPNQDGYASIICPWADEHTDPREDARWAVGIGLTGAFKCFHGACQDRHTSDLLTWLEDNDGPNFHYTWSQHVHDTVGCRLSVIREAVASSAWPAPAPLVDIPPSQDYPIDALPDLVRQAIEEAEDSIQAPRAFIAASALSAVSFAVQSLYDVRRGEGLQGPTSLFMLTIADSGERKSTCDKHFWAPVYEELAKARQLAALEIDLFQAQEDAWAAKRKGLLKRMESISSKEKAGSANSLSDLERELAAHEALKPIAPRLPRATFYDTTIEAMLATLRFQYPSGALVADEAGAVFGGHAMSPENVMKTFSSLNKLYDGSSIEVDRRTKESFSLEGARLTAFLQTQPATFAHFIDSVGELARGIGFLARFLMLAPASTQGTRMYRDPVPGRPALSAFARCLAGLLNRPRNINQKTGALTLSVLELSPDAKAAWVAAHDEIEKSLGPLGSLALVRDFAAKAADNIARLAALIHVVETGGDGRIGQSAIKRADRIVRWHLNEALRIWGQIELPLSVRHAIGLEAWISSYCRSNGTDEVSLSHVLQYGPSSIRSRHARDAAIDVLRAADRIRIRSEGRVKKCCLNPALLRDG